MLVWWVAAGIALAVAVLAGVADWRRTNRANLDRISWVDWRTLQMAAIGAAVLCAIIAQHAG